MEVLNITSEEIIIANRIIDPGSTINIPDEYKKEVENNAGLEIKKTEKIVRMIKKTKK